MRVTRKETNNPRARIKCKYDLTGVSPEEYKAIIQGLELVKDDSTAAELLKTLKTLEEGATV